MSYLAIARKYRPATFDQMVGQQHVTRTLTNAIERGRIHHGFLFCGARGVGKTTAARALARSLNCAQGPTPEPCGTCTSCTEIAHGTSTDLIEIDGASNNSVDDIRELRETVRYAPTQGRWKIYLVDEVHMLSKGAFNALLKTLEEPPPHVVFIFATTEPHKIPDTILSRVQRFEFKRIAGPHVVERLKEIAGKEGAAISDDALRLIARAGEGSMRDAESLLDQVISFGGPEPTDAQVAEILGLIDRGLLYDMLDALVTGRPDRCLEIVDQVYGYGYELSVFTGELLEVLRNATFVSLSPTARKFVDLAADEVERLDTITKDCEPEVLSRTFSALLDVHDQVSRASRPRVVLEMAVARLATTRPLQPVGQLLGRLENLERRLRQGGAPAPIGGMRNARSPRRNRSPAAVEEDDLPRSPPPPAPADDGPPFAPPEASPVSEPVRAPRPPAQDERERPNAPSPARRPQAPKQEPQDPWERFQRAARDVGAGVLADGLATFSDGVLKIALAPGFPLAEGRRLLKRGEVAAVVGRCYPQGTRIEVVEEAGARPGDDDLRRTAHRHPVVQRFLQAGATLGPVTRLDDGES